jgi:hypothetical protein
LDEQGAWPSAPPANQWFLPAVQLAAAGGVVALTWMVRTQDDTRRAEQIVRSAQSVHGVVNNLPVQGTHALAPAAMAPGAH